jgi:hypothetical protein
MAVLWKDFVGFLAAHPMFYAVFVWPLLSAVVSWVFKPRTTDEYAAMNPRLASVLRLVGALGIDPAKALQAIAGIFGSPQKFTVVTLKTPPSEPPKEPKPDPRRE